MAVPDLDSRRPSRSSRVESVTTSSPDSSGITQKLYSLPVNATALAAISWCTTVGSSPASRSVLMSRVASIHSCWVCAAW